MFNVNTTVEQLHTNVGMANGGIDNIQCQQRLEAMHSYIPRENVTENNHFTKLVCSIYQIHVILRPRNAMQG